MSQWACGGGRVAQAHFFLSTGRRASMRGYPCCNIRERQETRVPHASILRVGVWILTFTIDPVSRQELGTTRPEAPHVSPTCGAPKFISPLGVHATRPRHS